MSGRRRLLGAALGVMALLGAGLIAPAQQTDAAWTDPELASASLTARTVPVAEITSCTVQTLLGLGLVFKGVTLTWRSSYDITGVRFTITPSGGQPVVVPSSNITKSGPVGGPYTYTAQLSLTVLQNLLQNLLGSSSTLSVMNVETYPQTTWVSAPVTRTLTVGGVGGLLGNNRCQ